MKTLDLTGQRFGSLTAISVAEKLNGKTAWLCRCDCGNEVTVPTKVLRSGGQTSCGCGRSRAEKRKIDIVGQRFGMLTVLYRTPIRKGHSALWHCRCDCGNECNVGMNNLRGGHTVSCGCQKIEAQQDATARMDGLQKSPLTGRFWTNRSAKWYQIEYQGRIWKFRNMRNFVREHSDLFDIDPTDPAVVRVCTALCAARKNHCRWHGFRVQYIDPIPDWQGE